jgi:hypothetical protein
MGKNKKSILEFPDTTDSLGKVYIITLFISGAIWAFIAVNNFDTPNLFKLALIYSLLLIFGLFGILYDRQKKKFGIDSRIWESSRLRLQLIIGIIFFAIWYIVFIKQGFAVASAQSIGQGALFAVNPTLNYFLITFLAPLAEDIFFLGILNITFILIIRSMAANKIYSVLLAAIIFALSFLIKNVPNITIYLGASAVIIIATSFLDPKLQKYPAYLASALCIGASIFPAFHGYAYQLNERNYIAASWFGLFACLLISFVGLLPVDLAHIANNILTAGG